MIHQRLNIKNLFESRPNEWIPLYDITPFAVQHGARIFELKRYPYNMDIRNMTKKVNGVKHSWYRYTPKIVIISKQQEFPYQKEA